MQYEGQSASLKPLHIKNIISQCGLYEDNIILYNTADLNKETQLFAFVNQHNPKWHYYFVWKIHFLKGLVLNTEISKTDI